MEIGLWVFVGAKGKVDPHIASYAWVPNSWSFVKLYEVGNFPTLVISSLKVMNGLGFFLEAVRGHKFQSQIFGTECRNF